ncbi:MAG: DUF7482 domain-containing protein [Actinomycetota bacterium]
MQHRSAITTGIALALVGALVSVALASARKHPTVGRGAVVPPTIRFSYYDSHLDAYVETDVSDKQLAKHLGINYSPVMAKEVATDFPAQFEVKGKAASGQLTVFGSEPGETSYTPFWDLIIVRWKPGVTPVLLEVDDQINKLAAHGKLTLHQTSIITNAPIIGVDVTPPS